MEMRAAVLAPAGLTEALATSDAVVATAAVTPWGIARGNGKIVMVTTTSALLPGQWNCQLGIVTVITLEANLLYEAGPIVNTIVLWLRSVSVSGIGKYCVTVNRTDPFLARRRGGCSSMGKEAAPYCTAVYSTPTLAPEVLEILWSATKGWIMSVVVVAYLAIQLQVSFVVDNDTVGFGAVRVNDKE